MTSEVARGVADNIIEGKYGEVSMPPSTSMEISNGTAIAAMKESSSSAYSLAEESSQFSRDIDRWMGVNQVPSTDNGDRQRNGAPMVQRSVIADLPPSPSFSNSGIWYILAMVLPLFSLSSDSFNWRCTACIFVHTAEMFINLIGQFVARIKQQLRALAQDQVLREIFATAMDVVLVIYALGFLVISMYQASIFG